MGLSRERRPLQLVVQGSDPAHVPYSTQRHQLPRGPTGKINVRGLRVSPVASQGPAAGPERSKGHHVADTHRARLFSSSLGGKHGSSGD